MRDSRYGILTYKGRVVYDRKQKKFTWKDVSRIAQGVEGIRSVEDVPEYLRALLAILREGNNSMWYVLSASGSEIIKLISEIKSVLAEFAYEIWVKIWEKEQIEAAEAAEEETDIWVPSGNIFIDWIRFILSHF